MRELSAARPATLRAPHDNTPSHGNPPRPARQLSRISTTTLRLRQPSATDTAALRGQHGNPPERGNSPRIAPCVISTRNAGNVIVVGNSAVTTQRLFKINLT